MQTGLRSRPGKQAKKRLWPRVHQRILQLGPLVLQQLFKGFQNSEVVVKRVLTQSRANVMGGEASPHYHQRKGRRRWATPTVEECIVISVKWRVQKSAKSYERTEEQLRNGRRLNFRSPVIQRRSVTDNILGMRSITNINAHKRECVRGAQARVCVQ